MSEVRSAAAQAGIVDQPLLVMDMLAKLTTVHSVAECFEVWRKYVSPVYDTLCSDTIEDLERGVLICVERIAKPRR